MSWEMDEASADTINVGWHTQKEGHFLAHQKSGHISQTVLVVGTFNKKDANVILHYAKIDDDIKKH